MRKIIVFIVFALLIITIKPVKAQDKALKSGFSINLITGFPSPENYGLKGLDPDLTNKLFIGLEIGNRWYIKPQEKFGFGIMVNWFDVTMQFNEVDPLKEYSNNRTYVFNISFFELGPIGTYAITPDIGIDAYYNIRPTYMNTGIYLDDDQDWDWDGDIDVGGYDADDETAMGFSHTCGLSIRRKALALSFEYILGNIRTIDGLKSDLSGDFSLNYGTNHLSANHFRIMLGFKF